MPVSTPPVWTDPGSGTLDIANGGVWTAAAVDGVASDLKFLGGVDGNNGAAQPHNLLVNPGFEIWQRGNGPFSAGSAWTADRWQLAISTSTASISRSFATLDTGSGSSLAFTYTYASGGAGYIQQKIEDCAQLSGRTVTFTARIYTTAATGVYVQINDNSGLTGSAGNVTLNGWETISVTRTIVGSCTSMTVSIVMPATASTVCYIDNCMLYVGAAPVMYRPLHPAEDLLRCQRYYEILGAGGSNLIIEGIATAGAQTARLVLPYKVQKAINPTVTRVGTWSLVNCSGQPVPSAGDQFGCYLTITSSAAGQFNAVNNVSNAWVSVDAPQ